MSDYVKSKTNPKGVVIANPIDREAWDAHGATGLEWDVLAAGRLVGDKGFDFLIRALGILFSGGHEGLRVGVAGTGPDADQLRALADQLLVADWITWLGRLSSIDLAHNMKRARIVAVPSRAESFGLSALQGVASGARVLASDAGALPEVFQDTAVFHAVGDVPTLALQIEAAMEEPREIALPPAAHALLERCDVRHIAEAYLDALGNRG